MNALVPEFLFPYMLYGTLLTLAALLFGLNRSLKIANWPVLDRRRAVSGAAALLAAIYAATLLSARLGWYHGVATRIPNIQYGLLSPIALGILLFFVWPSFKRVVETVPQQWLVGLQLYRVEGLIFLVLYAAARLPGEFALPAGIGDVAVGLLAPLVATASLRKWRYAGALLLAWNVLGLIDLGVAVTMGVLTSPSPIQRFALNDPNVLISMYPLVMVPLFLVPLAILLHLRSLQRLAQTDSLRRTERGLRTESATEAFPQ